MLDTNKVPTIFFMTLFIIMIVFNGYLFQGMIHPILFGAIMAGVFSPFKKRIMNKFKLNKTMASFLTISIMILVVILPSLYILIKVSKESISLFQTIKVGLSKQAINDFFFGTGMGAEAIEKTTDFLGIKLSTIEIEQKLLGTVKYFSSFLLNFFNSLFSNLFTFLINFLIMILTTFALLYEGEQLKNFALKLSPLPDDQEHLLVDKFNQMNYVTLACNGLGGLIQGFLAALGLYFAGVESIFLWFVIMVFLAFIPLLGISVVTVPASLYFIITGEVSKGIILFIYSSIIAVIIENWFKAKFIGDRIKINGMLIFFYIMAGMSLFGMAGIFYGPLILSIFLTMTDLYHNYYYRSSCSNNK